MAQGTIKDFDEQTRTGSLLMEDHAEIRIDRSSIGDEAIRTLRIGQRVKFDLEEKDGERLARDLRIVTFE
ncbi:MAG: cold shock domain-containing protein [Actinomycetota bacterium]|nr:cold shock domain-containing protein [Actinomycetota bacterium]